MLRKPLGYDYGAFLNDNIDKESKYKIFIA